VDPRPEQERFEKSGPGPEHAIRLSIVAAPLAVTGRRQVLEVRWNGVMLHAFPMTSPGFERYSFRVHQELVRRTNLLTLSYGYTASPRSLSRSEDGRVLAVRFRRLDMEPQTTSKGSLAPN